MLFLSFTDIYVCIRKTDIMTLAEEYEQQNKWRNWASYLRELPIRHTHVILDLGCGTGEVTRLLGERCLQVIGVDQNPELLQFARNNNKLSNVDFIDWDLTQSLKIKLPKVDGIWCSFTAAYFPDFKPVLLNWIQQLKPDGWIAIVEIDNLFGHHPLKTETEAIFKAHYKKLYNQNIYDFEMGSKLYKHLVYNDLTVIFNQDMNDPELAFNGPADDQVICAWQNRFDRMTGLQRTIGINQFICIKEDFLSCLNNANHYCSASVKYLIAKHKNS